MEHPFYKKIGYLFIFLVLLGWCLVLFYNAIPLEFKSYIIEKNKFLLVNAEERIRFLSEDPTKSIFIFICSFYLGLFFTFSYMLGIIFLRGWYMFDIKLPIYKAIFVLVFGYIFFSSFYIFCLIFPGADPRMDRLFWAGGFISNIAVVFIMVWQGFNNIMIFHFIYLIRKLIKGGTLW
ncbi:hypothetical protein [Avibacterium paragallinarum]|uniref:Uncharacterized protein n=1 Tax=Avibacterium paragallinarum TaxID=728 RepID=A0A8B3T917_AVIPA|nr:hypothetical protein [Avibacterium paragallinarum]RZN60599.1 hypothetical protein EIG79_03130 [Avibacterium paragallinarum]RZN60602.1 hypothetical protein EIG79_03145 [Avibacterium paragallinarum]